MKKLEREFQKRVRELGCICCRLDLKTDSTAELHHMLSGGRRRGEMFVLPLCPSHHRSELNNAFIVSRDHNQRRFEARYGKEDDLLATVKKLIGWIDGTVELS